MASFRLQLLLLLGVPSALGAQALNLDFGPPAEVPGPDYGAAGLAGVWNGLVGAHGTTTRGLLDVDGRATPVSVRQLGGMDTPTTADPSTTGDDAALLDDYVVTFSATLESCLFFEHLEPGPYEVLIYAWMPLAPDVESYTDVDQEAGNPHSSVGGPWSGEHQELVTYSRHVVEVASDGILNMHSGIVPGADPFLGAALNAVQIRPWQGLFEDDFESGDTEAWDSVVE